jgi:hypothetical protein
MLPRAARVLGLLVVIVAAGACAAPVGLAQRAPTPDAARSP